MEFPGLVDDLGRIRSLGGIVRDLAGPFLLPDFLARIAGADKATLPLVDEGTRIGPCVGGVGKIICIGLNYSDHAAESGMEVPDEPVLFMKATSSISGPYDDVVLPRNEAKGDWEIELGVVIGKPAKYVTVDAARSHIAGYCVVNDLSAREAQLEGTGQWVKGKSADTFAPIGPWLVTADEVPDPQNLDMWLEIDGHRYQDGNTKTMIFGVDALVSYVSQFMSLQPGDIISTGTPPGVGLGLDPQVWLQPGNIIRLGIAGLGEQRQKVVAAT
jgi:2-keto-4-pentenoate hydratase/2-oxohepta-3-ene-1,7-dioic acid hydratase in catechol pathway